MQTPVGVALLGDPGQKYNDPDQKYNAPDQKHKYNQVCGKKSNIYVYIKLTEIGKIIQININKINANNNNINIEPYVIMPDHIHFIIEINQHGTQKTNEHVTQKTNEHVTQKTNEHVTQKTNEHGSPQINEREKGSPRSATPTMTVPKLINSFKSIVSKQIGYSIWQRGYYEKIIRTEREYYNVCEYIKNNPLHFK